MSNRIIPTLIIAGLAAAAAGCGSSGSDESTAAKPAAQQSSAPYGTYVRAVTKTDLARTATKRDEHGPNQEAPLTGNYRLVVAKGAVQDVIKTTDRENFTIGMDVNADQGLLKATSYVDPNRGSFCGPEIPAYATYSFKVSGSTLVLQPKQNDPCADRDAIWTGTWKKG